MKITVCGERINLLLQWEKEWDNDVDGSYSCFKNSFIDSYNYASDKIQKNRKYNFLLKWIYIIFLFIAMLAQVYLIYYFISSNLCVDLEYVTATELPLLLVVAFFTLALSKVLDVKKYQETWSRHQRFQLRRDQEMMCYLMSIGKYEGKAKLEKAKAFIINIMNIERDNIDKFCDNMDNKEAGIREGNDIIGIGNGKKK